MPPSNKNLTLASDVPGHEAVTVTVTYEAKCARTGLVVTSASTTERINASKGKTAQAKAVELKDIITQKLLDIGAEVGQRSNAKKKR